MYSSVLFLLFCPAPKMVGHNALMAVICLSVCLSLCLSVCLHACQSVPCLTLSQGWKSVANWKLAAGSPYDTGDSWPHLEVERLDLPGWVRGNVGPAQLLCFTGMLISNGRWVYYDVHAESSLAVQVTTCRWGSIWWWPHLHVMISSLEQRRVQ